MFAAGARGMGAGRVEGGDDDDDPSVLVMDTEWEMRADGRRVRLVADAAGGRWWRVWEQQPRPSVGSRVHETLIFDSGEVVRRCARFPHDWATMPAAELLWYAEHPCEGERQRDD